MSGPLRITGLDLSIVETGVAFTSADDTVVTSPITTKDKDGDARLVRIRDNILELASGSEFVLMEAAARSSFTATTTGMVHGVARLVLVELGIPYATVMPNSLKKYATGKGGATKADMAVAAFKRGGGIEFANDNECDAWWLWHMSRDFLGSAQLALPALQRQSLKTIKYEWKGRGR